MRGALLLVMATGCSQLFGLDSPVAIDAASVDGAADATDAPAATTCVERWLAGPQLAAPSSLAMLNTPLTQERLPFVTYDGTKLYYIREGDVFVSTAMNGTFGAGAREVSLSSGTAEGRVWVADTGDRAFLSSSRNGGTGGGTDLWRASRPDPMGAWTVDQMYLDNLNAAGEQTNPFLTADLRHIYYAAKNTGLMFATRTDPTVPFDAPTPLTSLASNAGDDDAPAISGDERVIVFDSRRSGNGDLYYATRADPSGPFGAPQQVPGVNAPNRADTAPFLSADGCTLYFTSDRGGTQDLFVATLTP
jgi:hypothetical protein